MRRLLILFSILGSVIGWGAEPVSLSGPVSGYLFDAPTGSFRAVIGFPGSALLGPAISGGYTHGSVAPQKDYGLAFQDSQASLVSGLSSAAPSVAPLSGLAGGQEGLVWAGDGSLAVLFSRTGGWIETVAGLPDAAAPGAATDLTYLGGALSAIGVDMHGKQIAVGMAGDSGGVYLITDGGAPVSVLPSAKPIALSFSPDGSLLYALDGATLSVTAVSIAGMTPQTFSLDGMADPIALKSALDASANPVLYVAGRNDQLLRTYDASSFQLSSETALDFAPTEIRDLGVNSFLLAPRSSDTGSLWLFRSAPQQAVFFVPPASVGSGGSE